MSDQPLSRQPIEPLSVGNVVSAAIVLYRSHLKSYLGISLRAYLWILPVNLGLIFLPLILNNTEIIFFPLGLIVIPIWLVISIYGFANYLTDSALISRLAFREFTNQPETISSGRSYVSKRIWSFLRIAFQVFLYLIGIYLLLTSALLLGGGIIGLGFGFILTALFNNQVLSGIAIGLVFALGFVAWLFGYIWFFSRWIVAELPLAVEDNITGSQSVTRSWELTKNSENRILLILIITFLVTFPILGITGYAPQIILMRLEPSSQLYWIVNLLFVLTSLGGGILVLPFWQTIKAVLYGNLRSIREGMGLQLRDSFSAE